ncbi:MAG: hypothetical protein V1779_11135 [bacterium]
MLIFIFFYPVNVIIISNNSFGHGIYERNLKIFPRYSKIKYTLKNNKTIEIDSLPRHSFYINDAPYQLIISERCYSTIKYGFGSEKDDIYINPYSIADINLPSSIEYWGKDNEPPETIEITVAKGQTYATKCVHWIRYIEVDSTQKNIEEIH